MYKVFKKYGNSIYVIELTTDGKYVIRVITKYSKNNITTKHITGADNIDTVYKKYLRDGYKAVEIPITDKTDYDTLNYYLESSDFDANGLIRFQKAYPFDVDEMIYPCWAQRKYNGIRMRSTYIKNTSDDLFAEPYIVQLSNKTGLPLSIKHIEEELLKIYELLPETIKDIQFDGESYIHGLALGQINGASVNSKNPNHKNLTFQIFDIIDLSLDQTERFKVLREIQTIVHCLQLKYVQFVKTESCNSDSQALSLRNEFIEEGYEGVILRNKNAYYEPKRSHNMLKYKLVKEARCKILDVIPSGKYDKQGMFLIEHPTNGTTVETVLIASFLEREDVLKNKEYFIGGTVIVQYREETKAGKLFHTNAVLTTFCKTE